MSAEHIDAVNIDIHARTHALLVVQLQFGQKSLKAPVVTFIAFAATYHTRCCWQVTETKWPSTTSATTACHLKHWPHIQLETPGGLPSPNQKKTWDFQLCPNSNQNIQKLHCVCHCFSNTGAHQSSISSHFYLSCQTNIWICSVALPSFPFFRPY